MPPTFDKFFAAAFEDGRLPYGYQCRLACGPEAQADESATLGEGTGCESRLIDVPTGLGKTAAVVLAWLWNRVHRKSDAWPRRLVYCLPMRTLVEQTRDEVAEWLRNLAKRAETLDLGQEAREQLAWLSERSPIVLMGGEDADSARREWDIHPERPAILIGTQDMLLSRALNRGYGMSRYRWPMHFGLLNNDCLWVMDEVQLMGSGLWTSAQLDWMREHRFPPQFPTKTWWMSATMGGTFLDTSDRTSESTQKPDVLQLGQDALNLPVLRACRPVSELKLTQPKEKKGKSRTASLPIPEQIAAHVADNHVPGTLSLVVCNRVAIAQEIRRLIGSQAPIGNTPVKLLTSRFRSQDRADTLKAVLDFEKARREGTEHTGIILVSTQVVEAGFDVSATRLWTQLAPWPSIIQRFGRLNRDGLSNGLAHAYVFALPEDKKDPHSSLPYDKDDLRIAKTIVDALVKLCAAHPEQPIREILQQLSDGPVKDLVRKALEPKPQPYPRALDVHGIFSTEPDVFGGFTDVSPWVRNADASADVTVFWRDFEDKANLVNKGGGPGFQRQEGCSIAVHQLKKFLSGGKSTFQWNPKADQWERIRPDDIRPGMTLLLPAKAGGYDILEGWTGEKVGNLGTVPAPGPFEQSDESDRETEDVEWIPLDQHLTDAEKEARTIAEKLDLQATPPSKEIALVRGAALHDIGKSLQTWQEALLKTHSDERPACVGTLWAKSPRSQSPFRPGLRHEVASALAMWHRYYREGVTDEFPALAIYLVAAHHGKARTVLAAREKTGVPNVCGIPLPTNGTSISPLPWPSGWQIDFAAAEDGASGEFSDDGTEFYFSAPGWTGLVADLLGGWEKNAPTRTCGAVPDHEPAALGPFALAYFEALLRAADARASGGHQAVTPGVLREESAGYENGTLSPSERELVAALVKDGLSIQDRFHPEPTQK